MRTPPYTPWNPLYPRGVCENRGSYMISLPDYEWQALSPVDHSHASLPDGTEFAQIINLRIPGSLTDSFLEYVGEFSYE